MGWWEAPENTPLNLKGPVHRKDRKGGVRVEIHKDSPRHILTRWMRKEPDIHRRPAWQREEGWQSVDSSRERNKHKE